MGCSAQLSRGGRRRSWKQGKDITICQYMIPSALADALEGSQTSAREPGVDGSSGHWCRHEALVTETGRDVPRLSCTRSTI